MNVDLYARVLLATLTEPNNRMASDFLHTNPLATVLDRIDARDVPGVQSDRIDRVLAGRRACDTAESILEETDAVGARVIVPFTDEWPVWLSDLRRLSGIVVPLCLWVRGPANLANVTAQSVSVVGARCCTPYGRNAATKLGYDLAHHDWTVVSGGAFGIDAAAHQGALSANGTTVTVLACGVDRPYPGANTDLFDRIAESGLIVSQWPPGTVPQRHHFLIRNHLIAALSCGTVLVEAALRSGARHTIGRAAALDRYTAAVPGPVTSAASSGVHQVLRDLPGVRVVTRAADVITDLTDRDANGGTKDS